MAAHRAKAFTLVEMLIVVAVIAILLSMIVPTLQTAREAARTAVCASHLNQVGLAAGSYLVNNRQKLPPFAPVTGVQFSPYPTLPYYPSDGGTYQPNAYRRMYLLTEWFLPGPYPAMPRAGDGFLSTYMIQYVEVDETKPPDNADGTYGGMKSILGCPSKKIGPTYETHTGYDGGTKGVYTFRPFSYAVNYGDSTPWWPAYPGVFDITQGIPMPGEDLRDLRGQIVLMADGVGYSPYLHSPYPAYTTDQTLHRPDPRHVSNSFNAVFVDGSVKTGSLDKLWTIERWIHTYP